MKNKLVLIFIVFALSSNAQDKIYGYYNLIGGGYSNQQGLPQELMQINFNPSNHSANFTTSNATGRTIDYIGLNKENFLYGIEGDGMDKFNVFSYNTQNNFSSTQVYTHVNWNGGANDDARIRGMAIDKNNLAWVSAFSVINGKNYVTTFQTNSSGGASNFLSKPYIFKTDLVSVEIKDLAFDIFGNLFAIVMDAINGKQYIYFANVKTITGIEPGANIMLTRLWLISDAANKALIFDPRFSENLPSNFEPFDSYLADGLAFSSKGQLLLSVDKMTFSPYQNGRAAKVDNMLYTYKPGIADSTKRISLYQSPENVFILSLCDDLASNYFPAFLPLNFGEVSAKVNSNILQIKWDTETERNNAKFSVGVSTDGINFKEIAAINSLAANGNSNENIKYAAEYNLPNSNSLFYFSGAWLLIISLLCVNKKKSRLIACSISILLAIACSKKDNSGSEIKNYSGKIFVKITAIDTDNKITESKVVQALR